MLTYSRLQDHPECTTISTSLRDAAHLLHACRCELEVSTQRVETIEAAHRAIAVVALVTDSIYQELAVFSLHSHSDVVDDDATQAPLQPHSLDCATLANGCGEIFKQTATIASTRLTLASARFSLLSSTLCSEATSSLNACFEPFTYSSLPPCVTHGLVAAWATWAEAVVAAPNAVRLQDAVALQQQRRSTLARSQLAAVAEGCRSAGVASVSRSQ